MSEIENILARIKGHKSVEGYIVTNLKGDIIKTTYIGEKKNEGDKIISFLPELVFKTQITVKNLDHNDELQFLRIKTKNNELLIAPDKEFVLIVVHSPFKVDKDQDNN
jgi:dynein light chain roadblock-type